MKQVPRAKQEAGTADCESLADMSGDENAAGKVCELAVMDEVLPGRVDLGIEQKRL